jgi:hypothetical protein
MFETINRQTPKVFYEGQCGDAGVFIEPIGRILPVVYLYGCEQSASEGSAQHPLHDTRLLL